MPCICKPSYGYTTGLFHIDIPEVSMNKGYVSVHIDIQ